MDGSSRLCAGYLFSKVIRIVGVVATKGGSSQSKALARSTSQN